MEGITVFVLHLLGRENQFLRNEKTMSYFGIYLLCIIMRRRYIPRSIFLDPPALLW